MFSEIFKTYCKAMTHETNFKNDLENNAKTFGELFSIIRHYYKIEDIPLNAIQKSFLIPFLVNYIHSMKAEPRITEDKK